MNPARLGTFVTALLLVAAATAQSVLPDGSRNPRHDAARLFWIAPSWAGLEAYAMQLNETRLPPADDLASAQRQPHLVELHRIGLEAGPGWR